MVGNEDKGIFLFCQPYFLYICIRKSYPNKQSDAGHGNWNGCQLITRKWGNSSNSLDFKEVYFSYRFTENLQNNFIKMRRNDDRRLDINVIITDCCS